MKKDIVLGLIRHLLTAAGGYLIAQGLVSDGELTEAVGAVITLTGIIWSAIAKRQAAKAAADNSFKLPFVVLLAGGLAATSMTFSGCQTTNAAGRSLATITITADHAVQGWMHWVAAGHATHDQELQVKRAYEVYQAAEAAAEKSYQIAYAAGDAGKMELAIRILVAARDDLLQLIATLQKK